MRVLTIRSQFPAKPLPRIRAVAMVCATIFACCASLGAQTVNIAAIAAGDGAFDDTLAIQQAINGSPVGATIAFGDASKIYKVSSTLTFPGGRTYSGAATIRLGSAPSPGFPLILLPNGNADDITISGLTFDAGGLSAIMHIATLGGTGGAAPKNVTITGCTFKNSPGVGSSPSAAAAIFNTIGLINFQVTSNLFSNVGHGLSIVNPSGITVKGNTFTGITSGDAMYFQVLEPLSDLTIFNNSGSGFYRMAVEIQATRVTGSNGQPVKMDNVTIQGNHFSNWSVPSDPEAFGISAVFPGSNGKIIQNIIMQGVTGYGIEAGNPGALVDSNTVSGFSIGIGVSGPGITVSNNTLTGQLDTGIQLSNANAETDTQVVNNIIANSRRSGIATVLGDHRGSLFQGNTILRQAGAFTDDATNTFQGIQIAAGLTAPINLKNNSIQQTSSSPVSGFNFVGLGLNGNAPGAVYDGNSVVSAATVAQGTGMLLGLPGQLDGDIVVNNFFKNLQRLVGNGPASGNVISANNSVCNVAALDPKIITIQTCSPPAPSLLAAITSPYDGQTITGTVSLTAFAGGGNGTTTVQYSVDGQNVGAPSSVAPYMVALDTTAFTIGSHTLTATARDGSGVVVISRSITVNVIRTCPVVPAVNSFTGCYYATISNFFSDIRLIRNDAAINFTWTGTSPDPSVPNFNYSVKWAGSFTFAAGTYQFTLTTNDGARLWIDPTGPIGSLSPNPIIDAWTEQNTTTYTAVVTLAAGAHVVRMDYFKSSAGSAVANLAWVKIGQGSPLTSAITFPSSGQIISGTITATASVSGGSGGTTLQFAVDGKNLGAVITQPPYSAPLDTTTLSNGTHSLTAAAHDNSGATANSGPITFSVSNGTAPAPPTTGCPGPATNAFTGCYYGTVANFFSNFLLTRTDPVINFDWTGTSPDPSVPNFNFSVHWAGSFDFTAGNYLFTLTTNDGSRLWIDPTSAITSLSPNPIIDTWTDQNTTTYTATVPLTAGPHVVRMDYFKSGGGGSVAKLSWTKVP